MKIPHWLNIPEGSAERIIAVELTRHDPDHTPGLGWHRKMTIALGVIRALRDAGYVLRKDDEPTP